MMRIEPNRLFGKKAGVIGCLFLVAFLGFNLGKAYAIEDKITTKSPKKLAIIIDDMGNRMGGTEEIISLPVKLTVAVMPYLETTQSDAIQAHKQGHDVLVHLPMEPRHGRPEWLGPEAIMADMSDSEIRRRVEAAIDQVPYAVGINNHMGSKVTGDKRVMSVILDVCRERGLFFVDSRTNYWSVIPEVSEEKGLPQLKNDIFLDDLHSEAFITGQLRKVQELLDQKGYCVTIGHVGTRGLTTASALSKYIPEFRKLGVIFVGISDLVREQENPGGGPGFTLP